MGMRWPPAEFWCRCRLRKRRKPRSFWSTASLSTKEIEGRRVHEQRNAEARRVCAKKNKVLHLLIRLLYRNQPPSSLRVSALPLCLCDERYLSRMRAPVTRKLKKLFEPDELSLDPATLAEH